MGLHPKQRLNFEEGRGIEVLRMEDWWVGKNQFSIWNEASPDEEDGGMVAGIRWKGKDFSPNTTWRKTYTCDWVEAYTASRSIQFQAPVTLVIECLSNECTLLGARIKFMITVWPQPQIASAAKHFQSWIVRFLFEYFLPWRNKVNVWAFDWREMWLLKTHQPNNTGIEALNRIKQHSESCFYDISMLAFSTTVLLRGIWTGNLVNNATVSQQILKFEAHMLSTTIWS